jgi:hypothetical protein
MAYSDTSMSASSPWRASSAQICAWWYCASRGSLCSRSKILVIAAFRLFHAGDRMSLHA